jgi:hypothetical protein
LSKKLVRTGLSAVRQGLAIFGCTAFLIAYWPAPLYADDAGTAPQDQAAPAPQDQAGADQQQQVYTDEQLDALLAPIALYPDDLLSQVLMATTYPVDVVSAYRWTQDPAHKDLKGDTLTKALESENWDPSVKSLVPFPQVLNMMNDKLDWVQQVGYAMGAQQADVFASVQRLRKQAQNEGNLESTPQQTVTTQPAAQGGGQTIVIQPAQPDVVYVPTYNPSVVYGTWPYPSYPPVYWPPPPAYYPGQALMTGLAFGAGIAITAGLWGWAGCNWGGGNVNVNVNRYNNLNTNRTANRQRLQNSNWQPQRGQGGQGAGNRRPPGGPVGRPARANGLPANGIGRSSVSAPGNISRPPGGLGPNRNNPAIGNGNRPGAGQGGRPNGPGGNGGRPPGAGQGAGRPNGPGGNGGRPAAGQRPSVNGGPGANGGGNRAGAGNRAGGGQRPQARSNRQGGAGLSGQRQGRSAGQFGQRGAQSRQSMRSAGGGGGRRAGGGGGGRGGGGRGGGGRGGGGRR